jgi:hypothetical protein
LKLYLGPLIPNHLFIPNLLLEKRWTLFTTFRLPYRPKLFLHTTEDSFYFVFAIN